MSKNNTLDTRELMSGKDGRMFVEFNGINYFMAELENFAVNMNVNTVDKQPVGSIVVNSVPTGVNFELTFTEMVVRDDLIMEPLLKAIAEGQIPTYNFQGVTTKPDGQEQRLAYNNCVPKGTFSLQNVTPGEVIQREQSYAINSVPNYLSALAATYLK